jgi:hypothetical protein
LNSTRNVMTRFVTLPALAVATTLSIGCGDADDPKATGTSATRPSLPAAGSITSQPLNPGKQDGTTLFVRLDPEEVGIDMVHPIDVTHRLKRLYDSGFAAGGVALGDIDGDGHVDIFFAGGPGSNKLYRQVATDGGGLRFEDITSRAGVSGGSAWGSGAVMVDIDGDGDLDIYVCYYDTPNQLFVNDGTGRFTDQAVAAGLAVTDSSMIPTFADYDNDGDLDCYLVTYRYYHEGGLPPKLPVEPVDGKMQLLPGFERYFRLTQVGPTRYGIRGYGRPDYFFRNDGNGTFTDVTESSGISGDGMGLSGTWFDYDSDGWIDLYVANDADDPDRLYRNNGDGTFSDAAPSALPHSTWFSMGSDAGDLDNDGLIDLFALDMSATTHYKQKTTMGAMNAKRLLKVAGPPPQIMRNTVFLNAGTGRFREAAYLTGLAGSDWSWAAKLADFDCDGRLDLFISNGVARNFMNSDLAVPQGDSIGSPYWNWFQSTPPRPEQNQAFRNAGDLAFDDVARDWGLDHMGMSYGTAYGDLDNDGDMDLVVVNLDEPVSVYRNQGDPGHRVVVRLQGREANTFGVGAVVTIHTSSGRQVRQLSPMTGFLSSNDPRVHFGLGEDSTIERLEVNWPGGTIQTFTDLAADQLYTITQKAADSGSAEDRLQTPTEPLYRASEATAKVEHHENEYDDFARQPLLPNKLSQLGPGLAVGDLDGDGREDLFIGGAAGKTGGLFLNRDGRFVAAEGDPFHDDRAAEDMGAVLLDVDSDGDLDLYVASGGYEFEKEATDLRDRLYLNDGSANFQRAPDAALPDVHDSGGCVVAGDFDRDGDLDLFVGGRVIPGSYPLSPNSRLLRNDSTPGAPLFTDVTDALAPGLRQSGLVTSALWSDADGDGWLDLLVCHEWGPVKFFRNTAGTLEDRTAESGTGKLLGWWNGITGRDIDGDSDIDYVVTNFGLNTKYHATPEKPASLYYGDVDGLGQAHLIEAEYEGDKLFPIRGKSCSTLAIPKLGEKFQSYHDFAVAELVDIYSPTFLDNAHRYEATTLESGILLNDGSGRFHFQPLPKIAQISPGFGAALTEIDGDGHPDLYFVQNFFSPQLETGRMDGGLSQLLMGLGDGHFEPVPPHASGLIVPGDAKSLVVTDLDGDRWPDFVVGVNNGQTRSFQHRGGRGNEIVQLRLTGDKGNATAVGAKVTLQLADGHRQTAEIYAGAGYLAQSSPLLTFGVPAGQSIQQIEVSWPDGSESQHNPDPSEKSIVIEKGR